MINYQSIFFTVTIYLSSLFVLFYILIFMILPSKKLTASEFDLKMCEHVATRTANVTYGDSSSWKYLREKIIDLQGDRCLCCGTKSKVMHVDHIKPKSRYPHLEYMIDNLQVLCPTCNREKFSTKETDYRKPDHLISLVREIKGNKLLRRKYVYDFDMLQNLAMKRFSAEMKNKEYPQVSPLT